MTSTRKTSKTLVAKVSNNGTGSLTVCDTDVSWDIQVAGAPTTGSVTAKKPGCKTLSPGGSTRFQFSWTYGPVR